MCWPSLKKIVISSSNQCFRQITWEFGVNVALGLDVADLCSRYGKLQFAFVPSTLAQSTFLFLAQAFLAQREILLMVIPFGRFKTF